jgi:4-azaleucine resistance transporter AzlC
MTALFVVIMVEQWMNTKEHLPALLGIGTTVVCLMIFGADMFIIPSMVLIAAELLLFRKKLDPEAKQNSEVTADD